MRNRLPFSLLVAAAALLILASSLSLAEPDEPVPIPVASVTTGKLEAKIAETEAASELGEEAKKQLLDLYRKALENLKTAASDTQTAEEYARVVDTAPARIEALREATAELQGKDPAVDLDAAPSEPLLQLDEGAVAALHERPGLQFEGLAIQGVLEELTRMFLADVPDQVRLLSVYGKLKMGFKNASGEEVTFDVVESSPQSGATSTLNRSIPSRSTVSS